MRERRRRWKKENTPSKRVDRFRPRCLGPGICRRTCRASGSVRRRWLDDPTKDVLRSIAREPQPATPSAFAVRPVRECQEHAVLRDIRPTRSSP
eukprot:ctg_1005.g396